MCYDRSACALEYEQSCNNNYTVSFKIIIVMMREFGFRIAFIIIILADDSNHLPTFFICSFSTAYFRPPTEG